MSQLPVVLVVEDEPAVVRVIVRALRGRATVASVGSVTAAIEHIDRHGVRPLLVDVRLPDGSGFDVVTHARSIDPRVPVLAMSGDASVANRAYALRTAFVQKPVEGSWLVEFVRRACNPEGAAREAVTHVLSEWSRKYALTSSESEILNATVVHEIARNDLAKWLRKSDATVKTQTRHLMAKIGHKTLGKATQAVLREALPRS